MGDGDGMRSKTPPALGLNFFADFRTAACCELMLANTCQSINVKFL
eukprot:COSAG05_NODE_18231_length_311_cov_1.080189_2_plen_45_part_01